MLGSADIGGLPYYGQAAFRAGNALLIDAPTLYVKWTNLLAESLARVGEDVRGPHFERTVQAAVDATPWSPAPEAHLLIGAKKLVDGTSVDIDVVAARGDELLLIETKSYARTGLYDSGDFDKVQRRAQDLEADLRRQHNRAARVRGVGVRGIDVRQWSHVTGIICRATDCADDCLVNI